MPIHPKGLVLSLALALSTSISSQAQLAGAIQSIKLLTQDTGWAATTRKVFWTTDGGAKWKDITPKLNHKRQMVSSVFFLDPSTGWALLSCGDDRDPIADDVCFEFALTVDAGDNWSVIHPKIVDPVPHSVITGDGQGLSGSTFLDFADAQHGWAIFRRNLPVGRSAGEMLRTEDGGHTWTQLAKGTLPIAEKFKFASAKDGWIAGGPDQELYVTHDGANNWQRVTLANPPAISTDLSPVYDIPTIPDGKIGYLPVTYESSSSTGTPVALFRTEDGGRTWRSAATTPLLRDAHPWTPYPSAVSNGKLLTASVSGGRIELRRVEPGNARAKSQSAESPTRVSTADQLSFVSPDRGWLLATYRLLSTSDGGVTWSDITPSQADAAPAPASAATPSKRRALTVNTNLFAKSFVSPPVSTNVSTHLGFDTFPTPPLSAMQAWTDSSPFYDVYIYLCCSPNKTKTTSKYPTTQWLSTVEGTYGFGVIPIWFGLQSSCVTGQPGITQYFGPTTADASTQGAEQADMAVEADRALGITGGIIYTDIESYTVNSTCSPPSTGLC